MLVRIDDNFYQRSENIISLKLKENSYDFWIRIYFDNGEFFDKHYNTIEEAREEIERIAKEVNT